MAWTVCVTRVRSSGPCEVTSRSSPTAFTGDAASHAAVLRPRLQHPDRLVVESRQHSLYDLRRVREEIERTLDQRQAQTGRRILASLGERKAVIKVRLRADQEHVASELASRYGSAVELHVGYFAFPERRRLRLQPPAGPALEEQSFEGLETVGGYSGAVAGTGRDGSSIWHQENQPASGSFSE